MLEAFHTRFHPAWLLFQSLINADEVEHIYTESMIPWWGTSKDDIHFNYSLGGGSIMSMGTYNFNALRQLFGAEPEECLSCETKTWGYGVHDLCVTEFVAKFRFPGGRIGLAKSTLRGPTIWTPSYVTVTTKEDVVPDSKLSASEIKIQKRELTMHGIVHSIFWHRIDIKNVYEIRDKTSARVIKHWEEKQSRKAYSFEEAGDEFASLHSEPYWMSLRHQLEQFVNRVKGRPTAAWMKPDESIAQMKMIDMAYEKTSLGLRPTSKFRP